MERIKFFKMLMIKRTGVIKMAVLLLLGSTLFTGCKKILDIHSTHAVDENNFWNSHSDTRAALIGVYGLMRAALADNNRFWMYGELRHGDFKSISRLDLRAVIDGKLNAPYPLLNDLTNWRRFYAVINAANMFLEHVGEVRERDPKYSEQNMRVDVAQIRCLRAFAYFYMVRIWGNVPFITTSHDGEFEPQGRGDQKQILAFVEQELRTAANDLPHGYSVGDEQQQGNYYNETDGRWSGALIRKLSAYAMLAHVAAWQGKYSDVAAYTQFILDNSDRESFGDYISTEDLTKSDGFFEGKRRTQIVGFNFLWDHTEASFSGHLEELTLAEPLTDKTLPDIYVPKDTILSLFNLPNDERFSLDTLTGQPTSERYFANFNTNTPIFSKIKVLQNGDNPDPDLRIYGSTIVFTRLAEITLLRAEALLVVGDKNEAADLLNKIRDARKLEHYDEAKEGDLLEAVFRERRKELMGEGWRWYDLIRYNKIKQNNPDFMKLIQDGGIYWPVSEDIRTENKLIKQTPYWR